MFRRWMLVVPLLIGLVQPASAGILFGRKKEKPPSPNERVPELVNLLKTDRDDEKRTHAAEELRQYDPVAFPVIIPALVEALQTDPKPNVRSEAAVSLGKLRPISDPAGQALEQALAGDSSMRVRMQARSALLQYHWAGYRTGKKPDAPPPLTRQPPTADPGKYPPPVVTTRTGNNPLPPPGPILDRPLTANPASITPPTGSRQAATGMTSAPVLVPPLPVAPPTEPAAVLGGAHRMPSGPAETPVPATPPASKTQSKEQGPDLGGAVLRRRKEPSSWRAARHKSAGGTSNHRRTYVAPLARIGSNSVSGKDEGNNAVGALSPNRHRPLPTVAGSFRGGSW